MQRQSSAQSLFLDLAFDSSDQTEEGTMAAANPSPVPVALFRQGVREHAQVLGMTLPQDDAYLWIAEESLFAALPEGWMQCRDEATGAVYFYNELTQESSWHHPRDDFYRTLFAQRKAADHGSATGATNPHWVAKVPAVPDHVYSNTATPLPSPPVIPPVQYYPEIDDTMHEQTSAELAQSQAECVLLQSALDRARTRIAALSEGGEERMTALQVAQHTVYTSTVSRHAYLDRCISGL